jgi:cell division protein FtsB
MIKYRLEIFFIFILLVTLFLQYCLWFQAGGIKDMMKLKKALAAETAVNENLKKDNEELLLQIKKLQDSQEANEARARIELGMIRKGEMFYQVVR